MSKGKYTDLELIRRLLQQARPYWLHIAGISLLGLISTPLALLTPLPLKIAVDSVLGSKPLPSFVDAIVPDFMANSDLRLLILVATLFLLIVFLNQLQGSSIEMLRTYTAGRLILDFRAKLLRHVQLLSFSFHSSRGTADSIYRIQTDAQAVSDVTTGGLIPFLSNSVKLGAMIYVTFLINWKLVLVALTVSPVLLVLARVYKVNIRSRYRHLKQLESNTQRVLQESLMAARVVKAFGREGREEARFIRYANERMRENMRIKWAAEGFDFLQKLTGAVGKAAIIFVGVRQVQSGTITLGDLLIVISYLSQLSGSLNMMSGKAGSIQSSLESAQRAFELLDEVPEVTERPHAQSLKRAEGNVAYDGVCFSYDGRVRTLHEISFQIPSGTRVGIAGRTGAGKSTMVSLLMRFYDPINGCVLLDGVDLRDYKLNDLRNQFSMVLQEPILFSSSITENIRYARPEAEFEQIVAAAKAAMAHDFIAKFPKGYDTQVGEQGMQLSGGQRQQIALARAFLKDAPILILDEPTSFIDIRAEAAIMEAIELLMKGRTTFLIAHRLSTLENCDLLLVLDNGKLVALTPDVKRTVREALFVDGQDIILSGQESAV